MTDTTAGPDADTVDDGPHTGPSDTAPSDTAPSDTGPSDTGPSDTGPAGAAACDTAPDSSATLASPAARPGRSARLAAAVGQLGPLIVRHRTALLVLASFTALSFALTVRLWADPNELRVAGNPGDTDLYQWWFGWWLHALTNLTDPWITYAMNWPNGVSLMANTSMALPALTTSWLFVTAGPLATYNVLTLLAPALSAWTAYLCARRLGVRAAPAYAGGLIFGFSQAIVHSMVGHLSMCLAFLLPVLVLLNVRAWRTVHPRRLGLTLGAVAFAQLMTGEEVLFQAAVATVIIGLTLAASRPRLAWASLPTAARSYGWALVVFVPLAAYPLAVQFLGPLKMHSSPFWVDYFAADLAAFTNPTELVWRGAAPGAEAFPGGITEHLAYLGWPLLLTGLAVAVARWADLRVRAAALVAIVAAVCSLGGTLWVRGQQTTQQLPWAWLQKLPLLESALPSRFGLLVALFTAALLAFGLDALIAGVRRAVLWPLAAAVAVAVFVTMAPQPLPVERVNPIPSYFTSSARALPDGTSALVAPFPTANQTEPLRWQTAAHYRYTMPGGYFIAPGADGHAYIGAAAGTTEQLLVNLETKGELPTLTPELRAAVAADFAQWGTDVVLLGPGPRQNELRALLTDLLGSEPTDTGGVAVWSNPRVAP